MRHGPSVDHLKIDNTVLMTGLFLTAIVFGAIFVYMQLKDKSS
jgi:hypothetical protein